MLKPFTEKLLQITLITHLSGVLITLLYNVGVFAYLMSGG